MNGDGKRKQITIGLFALLFGAAGLIALRASMADELPPATEGYIVQYKQGVDSTELEKTYEDHAAVQESEITKLRADVIKVPPTEEQDLVKKLEADPRVESVEPDYIVTLDVTPNDPQYSKQWAWPKMSADKMWDSIQGDESTIVAVIDSGVSPTHEDLKGKLVAGYDFQNNDNDPTDDNGHGTAVAAIVAAHSNNALGVTGGCWKCKIMPLKAMGNAGTGTSSNLAKAITYAADKGVKIISMSVSGDQDSSVQKQAAEYAASKGVQLISSAGNKGNNAPRFPASYPTTISVANTDQNDQLHSSSTFGTTVSVAAPGVAFVTADFKSNTGYVAMTGTSFSTPATAGVYAALKSAYPRATMAEMREAITKNVDTCCSGKINGGRVNAVKAMAYLKSKYPNDGGTTPNPTPPTPTPPTPTPPTPTPPTPNPNPGTKLGDLNGDGRVNLTDLSLLLSNWGKAYPAGDFNKNGKVDLPDLSVLLSNWNK